MSGNFTFAHPLTGYLYCERVLNHEGNEGEEGLSGNKTEFTDLALTEGIQSRIFTIRDAHVMLDSDLAALYQVGTKVLNQAVKRNKGRFPGEFCFRLTAAEFGTLKSQNVTASWGGRRSRPYAFTEQGVAMLSAVLRSDAAVDISVKVIRAFVAMRRFILSNAQIFQRLDTLELRQLETDRKMDGVLNALESGTLKQKQGIFFDGQVFDAHKFI